jgi:COPII coat assembly protein SEC16
MASDVANASWHPAFMPNNDIGHVAIERCEPDPQLPTEQTPELNHQDKEQSLSPTQDMVLMGDSVADPADAWFSQDSTDDWLAADPSISQDPTPQTNEAENADAIVHGDDNIIDSYSDIQVSRSTARHTSTISFARTISHEMSWNDDEDPDWSLGHTDQDPSDFMPPSDRTNSFPPVPPLNQDEPTTPISHGPSKLANVMDFSPPQPAPQLNVEDPATFLGDAEDVPEHVEVLEDAEDANEAQPYIGGDVAGVEGLAANARYEEGVPLISSSEEQADQGDEPTQNFNEQDSFSLGDQADDDDFFNQIQGPQNQSSITTAHPPLQRKSTSQVLEAINTPPSPTKTTLEDTLEVEEQEVDGIPSDNEDSANVQPTSVEPDLDAKWKEAFAGDDDDDFLLEDAAAETKEVDPASFFGSDDEGFLDDDEPATSASQHPSISVIPANSPVLPTQATEAQNRYTPQQPAASSRHQQPTSPYKPSISTPVPSATASYLPSVPSPAIPYAPMQAQTGPLVVQKSYGNTESPPTFSKAESFASKSRGGYTSPYDLPVDLKPRKRPSLQQLPRSTPVGGNMPAPPPRSSSVQVPSQAALPGPPAAQSPPSSSHGRQGPPPMKSSAPVLKAKQSFFEELPINSKATPAARQSNRVPSPSQYSPVDQTQPPLGPPTGPPQHFAQTPSTAPVTGVNAPPPPASTRSSSGEIAKLITPERVSPYAPLPSGPHSTVPTPPGSTRYSPAPPQPPQNNGVPPPATSNRYSPAPTATRPHVPSYGHSHPPAPQPTLPHLPRTSSPLAHFEISSDRSQSSPGVNGDVSPIERRSSSAYEPRVNRVSSLPPTREVEEEDEAQSSSGHLPANNAPASQTTESRYSPVSLPASRHTPPPPPVAQSTLSPPKRAMGNYTPQPQAREPEFAPPPRSQTQSPGVLYGNHSMPRANETVPRPSSMHSQGSSPRATKATQPVPAPVTRARGPSLSYNMVAPTDGRQLDPLQRWKGAPIISWGVGGTIVTSFPKNVPRYGISQTTPMIVRSPGEVHVKNVKDIQPLEDRLAKFPGPLKGKPKKKETISWLTTGIEMLERELPDFSFQQHLSHDDNRAVERLLLWKILRVFIEFDGTLEGTPAVEKAVRDVLSPGLEAALIDPSTDFSRDPKISGLQDSCPTTMNADAVDSSAIEHIRKFLLIGDREKAAWAAVDKRLWGHAMLISNTVSPDLYKQVAQEFVRKEVNYPGHNNESLAALYKVLSGNHEECVDELVPVHARAGLQLIATSSAVGPAKDALEGLDKWKETLGLVLSNRSPEDIRALKALGELLSGYGRAEAAHICFIFARNASVFGGLDDPHSNFVLVGSDHRRQSEQFGKETEALLLSEVYEYGLSLAGGSNLGSGAPHLGAYKLQHAMTLAEYGYRDKALQYCDAISNAMTSQTKRSPYYHPILEASVEDFMTRLKQAPKEESNSWITKPSMNKVSDSVWNRFNKFVAGDENENSGTGSPGDGGAESGPFARIAGGTPTISRSPSVSNFDMHGGGVGQQYAVGSPAVPAPGSRVASRYAPSQPPTANGPYEPSSSYNPASRSSVERTSNEFSRNPYEPTAPSLDSQPSYSNPYAPQNGAPQYPGYQPPEYGVPREQSFTSQSQLDDYMPPQPQAATAAAGGYEPYGSPSAVQPQSVQTPPESSAPINLPENTNYGYQPPSYGYEPPSTAAAENTVDKSYEPPSSTYNPTSTISNDLSAGQPEGEFNASGGYEPPSYQPYSYEPPSYEPDAEAINGDDGSPDKPKPRKRYMDDDDDDIPALKPGEKSKTEKDRENEEMFKKAAEEDGKW